PWVQVRPLDAGGQLSRHLQRDAVATLGPVERDPGNPPFTLVGDRLELLHLGSSTLGEGGLAAGASGVSPAAPFSRAAPRSRDPVRAGNTRAGGALAAPRKVEGPTDTAARSSFRARKSGPVVTTLPARA